MIVQNILHAVIVLFGLYPHKDLILNTTRYNQADNITHFMLLQWFELLLCSNSKS